jgi:hypothetical protein
MEKNYGNPKNLSLPPLISEIGVDNGVSMNKENKMTVVEATSGQTTNGVPPETKTFQLSENNKSGEVEIVRLYNIDEFAEVWGLSYYEVAFLLNEGWLENVIPGEEDGWELLRVESMTPQAHAQAQLFRYEQILAREKSGNAEFLFGQSKIWYAA